MMSSPPSGARALKDDIAQSTDQAILDRQYQDAFEQAGVGVARVATNGIILEANSRFCEILGRCRQALVGANFRHFTHPDDLELNGDLLERFNRGELENYRMQKRYIRASGEIVWTDLSVSPSKDARGQITCLISAIVDIGEQKMAEERQAYLMSELAHRSKNLLTVVQALLTQMTPKASSPTDLKDRMVERLRGMAASQDLLLSASWEASLADLIRNQISAFIVPDDPRFIIEGRDLQMGASSTHALGMAMHELTTNACKYGALSTPGGRVTVRWFAEDDWLSLSWVERGGPVATPPEHTGFGFRIIKHMVASSLNAHVDLDCLPEGLEWRLRAPLAAVSR